MAPTDFYEKANIFEGRFTNLTFSPWPLHSLLAILKNILELEKWTNGNQEFGQ
jgi:hypothetical protein